MTLRIWNDAIYRGFQAGRLGVAWSASDTNWKGWIALYRGTTGLHLRIYRLMIGWKLARLPVMKWQMYWPKNFRL